MVKGTTAITTVTGDERNIAKIRTKPEASTFISVTTMDNEKKAIQSSKPILDIIN